MNKKCKKCKKVKKLEDFHKYARHIDGRKNVCKSCRSIENKTVLKDRLKNKNLLINYGITLEEYKDMLVYQDYCCKICGIHEKHCDRGLYVDHCHETTEIRGLLCHNCNTGLGHFKDSPEFLQNAIDYLKKV